MIMKPVLNEYIHILLIDKELDGFSVPVIRDEMLKLTGKFGNSTSTRKFVYRQLIQLVKYDLLSTRGEGRKKTYHKTQRFQDAKFVNKPGNETDTDKLEAFEMEGGLKELMHEKARCVAELEFAVAGINEYRSLADRLPSFHLELLAKSEQSRERSVQYTVKLEALIYAIELYQDKEPKC
ncbi:hypothetical protein A165_09835 [Vibrio tasmaniensis ZS-17]|nr:hypothetical protein A165_09835 [Vibrio tasmaniensis ZS-17]